MTVRNSRVPGEEIFARLEKLLGIEAKSIIELVETQYKNHDPDSALKILANHDEKIGGYYGVFEYVTNKRKVYPHEERPIFRPFLYIYYALENPKPERNTRQIVNNSCFHIESILKYIVDINFSGLSRIKLSRKPMGSLMHDNKFKTKIPPKLYNDVLWLNDGIYRFEKHDFSDEQVATEAEARLFDFDEAIAVYFISRYLGLQLLNIRKLSYK